MFLQSFQQAFSKVYADFVDSETTDQRQLVQRIEKLGTQFTLEVFKGVNEFIHAVFEAILALYDPDIEGFLEESEKDLDKLIMTKTVQGQTYYLLLVLSRVMNKAKDQDLRFKAQALADVSPQDFGVDKYLLLNEQTPLVEMVETQQFEFEKFRERIDTRSSRG